MRGLARLRNMLRDLNETMFRLSESTRFSYPDWLLSDQHTGRDPESNPARNPARDASLRGIRSRHRIQASSNGLFSWVLARSLAKEAFTDEQFEGLFPCCVPLQPTPRHRAFNFREPGSRCAAFLNSGRRMGREKIQGKSII